MATSVKAKNRVLLLILTVGIIGSIATGKQLYKVEQFNNAVQTGAKPPADDFKFEAKYASAYQLANNGRYQDATQLFGQLMEMPANKQQLAAVQYDLGNLFLIRGLLVSRNGGEVKDEAEYLINQAKMAYKQSLRLDNSHMDVRYNLDRVLRLLPENPTNTDEQEELGIVMGNIPTGLP